MRYAILGSLLLAAAAPAAAKDVTVQMLNASGRDMMVFSPAKVTISPGDTVTFVPTDPGHNAESIPGMAPDGAPPFKGKMGKSVTVRFDRPGLYGVKCLPHFAMGMVALVQVGVNSPNLADARTAAGKLPGLARSRMTQLLAAAR